MGFNNPCVFCGSTKSRTGERRVRKRFHLKEQDPAPAICGACFPLFSEKKTERDCQKVSQNHHSDNVSIERLFETKNFALIGDVLISIQEKEAVIDGQTDFHLRKIKILQRRKSKLAKKADRIRQLSSVFPDLSYEFRRAEANQFISKPWVRVEIFKRDGFSCNHCGSQKRLTIDHIVPVKAGGSDSIDNLQTLCKRCNSSKGSKFILKGSSYENTNHKA